MASGRSVLVAGVVGLGAGWIAAAARRARRIDLRDRVVVITGGGRGLGYVIAQEFLSAGCRIAICGRDADEIASAAQRLRGRGAEVLGAVCDAAQSSQVDDFIRQVLDRFGCIDVLVNNAGQTFVGAATDLREEDVAAALRNIFWVQYHPTMRVLPHMRARQFGRIVNIASIGGKVPLPHQAAYVAGKFAVVGWSETLAAELAKDNIRVSTLTPPPLRDGASLYGNFLGRAEEEFRWFTVAANAPLLSTTAAAVARVVRDAAEHGDGERAATAVSWLLARAYGLSPNAMTTVMKLFDRLLPAAAGAPATGARSGKQVLAQSRGPVVQALGAATRAQAQRHQAS
jgi:NAD(P)-dependent dehydrogenase (short-subunit alcohol dehydrogenase family)